MCVCVYNIYSYISTVKGCSRTSSRGHDILLYIIVDTRAPCTGRLTGKKCAVCRCHNIRVCNIIYGVLRTHTEPIQPETELGSIHL